MERLCRRILNAENRNSETKISNPENNSSRQSLLEATKLSRLPSLPKRNSFLSKQSLENNQTKEQQGETRCQENTFE
jgi:hypothetical protein